jgi:predicted enzyme related to lactoylglutathione lyase
MAEGSAHPPPAAGEFCWNELMTPDLNASMGFYTQLFGWAAEEQDMGSMGKYTFWKVGDKHAGGMMQIQPEMAGAPPSWLSYVMVDDVDASTSKAESLGGKIVVPPADIPHVGRFSVILDPTGAALGLFQHGG